MSSYRYAQDTSVSSYQSRAEIERNLTRYGATSFAYASKDREARIMFEVGNRQMLFVLPMPDRSSDEFWLTPSTRKRRSDSAAEQAYEQAVRQRWRALALVIKAKLEAVQSGITTIEDEFLAHIVIPGTNGMTVGQYTLPKIAEAYSLGRLPELTAGHQ
jgi:hypothetical protein